MRILYTILRMNSVESFYFKSYPCTELISINGKIVNHHSSKSANLICKLNRVLNFGKYLIKYAILVDILAVAHKQGYSYDFVGLEVS
jgi:hypothetical protein